MQRSHENWKARSLGSRAKPFARVWMFAFCVTCGWTVFSDPARAQDDVVGEGLSYGTLFQEIGEIRPRIDFESSGSPEGDLDDSDVSWVRTGVRLRVAIPVTGRLALQAVTGARYVGYDFDGNGGVSAAVTNGSSLDDFVGSELRLGGRFILNEKWALLGAVFATSRFEWGVDFGDGLRGGAVAALARQFFDRRLIVALGVGVRNRFDTDTVGIEPYIQGEWRINDTWRLQTEGMGLRLLAKVSEPLRVFAFGAFHTERYRLDDRGPVVGEGSLRHQRAPVGLGVEWRPSRWLRIDGKAGAVAWQEFRVYDDDRNRIATESSDGPAAYLSLRARVRF